MTESQKAIAITREMHRIASTERGATLTRAELERLARQELRQQLPSAHEVPVVETFQDRD